MRIAFHAPLKPPGHDRPSGDRRVARLLLAALAAAGHEVEIASRFRSRDGGGDADRQRRLAALGGRLARRCVRRFLARPETARPEAWLTYHLYYKAPDHLGPVVADALGIPYLVAEASHAPKQAAGRWAASHAAAARAIQRADAIIGLNPADEACVRPVMGPGARYLRLAPFIDHAATPPPGPAPAIRQRLGKRFGIDTNTCWLLAVGMMRPGDKLASWRALGPALAHLPAAGWRLLAVGDGAARSEALAALGLPGEPRVIPVGEADRALLEDLYRAADLLVWPAVREAWGMALLEAQAAGLPVVAGAVGGVPDIIADGQTGLLLPAPESPDFPAAFAAAVAGLIADPARRRELGRRAAALSRQRHGIASASRALDGLLRDLAGTARS